MKRLFNERLAMTMIIVILLVVSCVAVGTLGETVQYTATEARMQHASPVAYHCAIPVANHHRARPVADHRASTRA